MRRYILIIIIFMLFISGCELSKNNLAGGTAAPNLTVTDMAGYDFDNRFGMGYDSIIETEDAYYYSVVYSNYLYYFDKKSGNSGVLCGKPDCVHDKGDGKDCNGSIGKLGASLNYWDGRLHYYSTDSSAAYALYSVGLDGSGRSKDTLINDHSIMNGLTPQRLDHHRGTLFGWRSYETVVDGAPKNCIDVISIDPSTGELREIFKKTGTDEFSQPNLYYFKNCVYISYETLHYTEEYKVESVDWNLLKWDIDSKALDEVIAVSSYDDTGLGYRIYIDSDERIWCAPSRGRTNEPSRVYTVENGELHEAFRFDLTWGCFLLEDLAVVYDNKALALEIRRLDGSLVYKGDLDTGFLETIDSDKDYEISSYSGIYGDKDSVFISFSLESSDGGGQVQCLVKYDLTGDKPVPTVIALAKYR